MMLCGCVWNRVGDEHVVVVVVVVDGVWSLQVLSVVMWITHCVCTSRFVRVMLAQGPC